MELQKKVKATEFENIATLERWVDNFLLKYCTIFNGIIRLKEEYEGIGGKKIVVNSFIRQEEGVQKEE